ncbi:siderophore-interacting protein [Corynebacterium sp. H113]|uniref:siderophore-interacting protein n=1 Tax=Corynebacterium sp. H113 TaxID=3133419 RepID=UPI0030A2F67D
MNKKSTVGQSQMKPSPKSRPTHLATVVDKRGLSPELLRVYLHCEVLQELHLPHSDHYIKLAFPPAEATYTWPFSVSEIRQELPREQWPLTRTYTVHSVNSHTGSFALDFVLHGDDSDNGGLASTWARNVEPGDTIAFLGPGGAWHPTDDYEHFILAGDETAAPAMMTAVEMLPATATADVYLEVASPQSTFDFPTREGVNLHWITRGSSRPGSQLSDVLRSNGIPAQRTAWFVHGVAEMIKDVRRFLFIDNDVAKSDVSISGYWRLGMTESEWQATKKSFNATLEAAEDNSRTEKV